MKWTAPDEEAVVAFLCGEKSFNEDRIRKQLADLKKARSQGGQNRLETFFGAATVKSSTVGKRKEPEKGKGKGKFGAAGGKKSKGVTKRKF